MFHLQKKKKESLMQVFNSPNSHIQKASLFYEARRREKKKMEYTLVKEENINEKLNLLKKEREIKREKYKLYLFLSFLLLASCIFIFWLYEKNVKDTAIINSDFSENLVGTKQLDK
jgi:hypothetical protein